MLRFLTRLVALAFICASFVSCCAPTHRKVPKFPPPNVDATDERVERAVFVVHVDTNFTEEQRAGIVTALLVWEKMSNGIVSFVVDAEPWDSLTDPQVIDLDSECSYDVYLIRTTTKDDPTLKRIERKGGQILGYTVSDCEERRIVLVVDRLKDAGTFVHVAKHEMGHLIGLDHMPIKDASIMYPYIGSATQEPTKLDAQQLCDVYKCNANELTIPR